MRANEDEGRCYQPPRPLHHVGAASVSEPRAPSLVSHPMTVLESLDAAALGDVMARFRDALRSHLPQIAAGLVSISLVGLGLKV